MRALEYAQLAEQFLSRLSREEYLHLSGLKETFETEQIFAEFTPLFTHEAVVERLENRRDRVGRYLAEFAAHGHIEGRIRDLTEEIANAESAAEIEREGERLPFRLAWKQLTMEPNHEKRRALEGAILQAVEEQNRARARRIESQRRIAQELGFPNYLHLCEALSGQSLPALAAQMRAFVKATEEIYRSHISNLLEGEGIGAAEATDADLRWALFAPRYECFFPAEKLVPAAEKSLCRLGLSLAEQKNIHLDLEPRPRKYPRPFCCPIQVPGEIWVVVSPRGGCSDFLSFFHEVGHAIHFSHMKPALPVQFRLMGDRAVGEAFAFVIQSIAMERSWLREVLGLEEPPEELLRAGRLIDLWFLRRYSGKVCYELELHGEAGPAEEMPGTYSRILGEAVGVRVSRENYLFDVDDAFYSATYLRAWMLDAALRDKLEETFGGEWFFSAEAGKWLQALWRKGQEWTAEELAAELCLTYGEETLQRRLLRDL